ncbi:hypothetical protein KC319_g347, partial [Hortaea werneckii]
MTNLIPHGIEACFLDEMDEGTARVIIDTQLKELEALPETSDPDTLLARETYEIELRRYRDDSKILAQTRLQWPVGPESTKRRLMEFWRWLTHWYTRASAQAGQHFSRGRTLKRSASPPVEESNKRQKFAGHAEAETQADVATSRIECAACGDEAEDEDNKNFCQVPCGDWYCDGCLQYLFTLVLTDESLFPARCCQEPFDYMAIKPRLPEELAAQYEAKKEELGNKNLDEALESVLKIAGDEDWQRCPDCKGMIELTFGCNHMTCPCSAEFCYVCTEPWKNCDCAQWVEERLIDRAQTVAERGFAGGDVQVAAQRLRNDITCDHERAYNSANWRRFDFAAHCEECRERMPYYIFECRLSALPFKMDVAYDHVQEESYSPANANDQSQKQANTSEPPQTLNTEFQQAFQAVSASPWGFKLGGWFNQARKQGEAYLTDLQKEAQDAQGQAAQGWSKLQEEVTNRTRGLSLNAEPAPASGVPGEEAVPSIKTT